MRAQIEWVDSDADVVLIRDVGHATGPSVTSDAEAVVRHLHRASALADRRLFYVDSEGDLSELMHTGGRFDGYCFSEPGWDAPSWLAIYQPTRRRSPA